LKGKSNDSDKAHQQKETTEDEEDKQQNEKLTGQVKEFTQEELQEAWKKFAEEIKGKPRLYNMLLSRTPKISNNSQIVISLENQLQKEILEKEYNKLLFFLRKELQNDNISLETQIKEKGEETVKDKRLYTVEEKYQHLKQKNQLLDKLKKDLDLDFDY
jgi:chromosomal replication initiation ATPase DnaA